VVVWPRLSTEVDRVLHTDEIMEANNIPGPSSPSFATESRITDALWPRCAGSQTNTFGVPGVKPENQVNGLTRYQLPSTPHPQGVDDEASSLSGGQVYFLKNLSDSRAIRSRIIECFERASYPGMTEVDKVRQAWSKELCHVLGHGLSWSSSLLAWASQSPRLGFVQLLRPGENPDIEYPSERS
jgi:hypothetical protein